MDRELTERFQVGVIASTHGLRGEVKVFPTTQFPDRFLDLEDVMLVILGTIFGKNILTFGNKKLTT